VLPTISSEATACMHGKVGGAVGKVLWGVAPAPAPLQQKTELLLASPCPLPPASCPLQDYAGMLREAGFDGVAALDRTEQVGGEGCSLAVCAHCVYARVTLRMAQRGRPFAALSTRGGRSL